MTKHNQSRSLGSIADFQTAPQTPPETTDERFERLERRIIQVESLLNDVMQTLDKPYKDQSFEGDRPNNNKAKPPQITRPKQQAKHEKKPKPSEKITTLLENSPQSRAEIETATGLTEEGVIKCIRYMIQKRLIEKTKEKDSNGNSRWTLTTSTL